MKCVGDFYSGSTEIWLKILGEKCHYNIGIYDGINDQSDNLVRSFYKFLNYNSKILDCGCGWGGTSIMLKNELGALVTSITNSNQQYEYLKNVLDKVIFVELENFIPTEKYDCAIFVQSICHIEEIDLVLKNLSNNVRKIIINEFFSYRNFFKNEEWGMNFRTIKEYKDILNKNNFTVVEIDDITSSQSKKEFAKFLLNNINKLDTNLVTGQILSLKNLCLQWTEAPDSRDYGLATIYAVNNK